MRPITATSSEIDHVDGFAAGLGDHTAILPSSFKRHLMRKLAHRNRRLPPVAGSGYVKTSRCD